jgi:hypothetical protein
MLTTMDRQAHAAEPFTPDRAHDAPACILAALIDSLTSPERYRLEVRNGELFIAQAHGRTEPQAAQFPASGQHAATGFCGC